jgi:hypothetical protein
MTNNNTILLPLFSQLPEDLVKIIISYSDAIIFRHGIYMDRFLPNDKRYNMLNIVVKKPLRYTDNRIAIWYNFPDKQKNNDKQKNKEEKNSYCYDGFVFDYKYCNATNIMKITKRYYFNSQLGYIYSSKNEEKYIIDANGYWRKTKEYTI